MMRTTYNKREQRLSPNPQISSPHMRLYMHVYMHVHTELDAPSDRDKHWNWCWGKHEEEEINENKDVKGRDDKSAGAGGPEGTEEEETGGSG